MPIAERLSCLSLSRDEEKGSLLLLMQYTTRMTTGMTGIRIDTATISTTKITFMTDDPLLELASPSLFEPGIIVDISDFNLKNNLLQ